MVFILFYLRENRRAVHTEPQGSDSYYSPWGEEKESRIKERDLPFPLGDGEEVSL